MATMQEIYLAVRDADQSRHDHQWEDIAAKVGMDPNGSEFDQLVKAMKVSGYIRVKDDQFFVGPTAMSDASGGGVIPARRPRPGSKTEAPDRLRLASRMHLWDDEKVAGSDYVREADQGGEVCVAGVTKAGQPTVRVGVQPEDRKEWEAQEDEHGTVVLDPEGVGALERGVEEVIAKAEEAEAPYKAILRRLDEAGDRLKEAEKNRVGEQAAEDSFYAQENNKDRRRLRQLWRERDDIDRWANALDESDRADYDDQQFRYDSFQDQSGSEGHVQASGDERRNARARQMHIIYPHISVAEAEEFLRIQETNWRTRPPQVRARERELLDQMGVQDTTAVREDTWLSGMLSQYGKDREIDEAQMLVERVEAGARPVGADEQAEIDAAWAEMRAAQAAWEAVDGADIHTVVIPGPDGSALVILATQGQEGERHEYRVDVRPADAGENWSPGHSGEPWMPKPADMRKLARVARAQCDAATPPGWRPPPSGVPQV